MMEWDDPSLYVDPLSLLDSKRHHQWAVRAMFEAGKKLKAAVVIGADTQELEGLFASHLPNLPLRVISGERVMAEAVRAAIDFASSGDTVLLAPAAASMDQFQDYADRGNQFQAEVKRQVIK